MLLERIIRAETALDLVPSSINRIIVTEKAREELSPPELCIASCFARGISTNPGMALDSGTPSYKIKSYLESMYEKHFLYNPYLPGHKEGQKVRLFLKLIEMGHIAIEPQICLGPPEKKSIPLRLVVAEQACRYFTGRQTEVLGCVLGGRITREQIAEDLVISKRTVKKHLGDMSERTGSLNLNGVRTSMIGFLVAIAKMGIIETRPLEGGVVKS